MSYLLAVGVLPPILGFDATLALMALPVVRFLSVNRWLWRSAGSRWAPRV